MIVRHFLRWIQTASAGDRADATAALARAYLHSDLTVDDRAAAEAAMMTLLDDPSPLVRRALADTLAPSADAPHAVLVGLLQDQPEIAALVARHSPILLDAELVDLIGGGEPLVQYAVAQREDLPAPVAAAIAEVGCLEACLALVALGFAEVPAFSIDRIVERFGMRRVSHAAMVAYLVLAVVHAAIALTGHETIWTFSIAQALSMFCFGLMVSNFGAMAMDPLGHVAGTASSVQGFLSTVGGALIGLVIGRAFDGTALPIVLGFLACGTAALVMVLVAEKGRLFRPHRGA